MKDRLLSVITAPFLILFMIICSQLWFWSLVLIGVLKVAEMILMIVPGGIIWIIYGKYPESLVDWLFNKWVNFTYRDRKKI